MKSALIITNAKNSTSSFSQNKSSEVGHVCQPISNRKTQKSFLSLINLSEVKHVYRHRFLSETTRVSSRWINRARMSMYVGTISNQKLKKFPLADQIERGRPCIWAPLATKNLSSSFSLNKSSEVDHICRHCQQPETQGASSRWITQARLNIHVDIVRNQKLKEFPLASISSSEETALETHRISSRWISQARPLIE